MLVHYDEDRIILTYFSLIDEIYVTSFSVLFYKSCSLLLKHGGLYGNKVHFH